MHIDMEVLNSSGDAELTEKELRTFRIVDGTFTVIFFLCFITVIWIAIKYFIKFPQIVNRMNIVIVILLGLTLLSKYSIIC